MKNPYEGLGAAALECNMSYFNYKLLAALEQVRAAYEEQSKIIDQKIKENKIKE